MQHMNFDTQLINHLARRNNKTWNDFSEEGTIQLAQMKADAFVDEMFRGENCNRKNGASLKSTQFTDALEILKMKRSLFLQKRQLSQTNCESPKLFLDKRSMDLQGLFNSGTENGHYASSSKSYPSPRHQDSIVVLRPAPKVMDSPKHVICSCSSLCSHRRSKGKDLKVKNTYFFLKKIKKRMKCALRNNQKKQEMTSPISSLDEPPTMKCINTGGGDKARPKSDKLKPRSSDYAKTGKVHETLPCYETAIAKLKLSDDSHSKNQEPHIFQEAKKHLSERLKFVNKSREFESQRTHAKLGRILCSPEHDFSVPLSLKSTTKHLSVLTDSGPSTRLSDDYDPMISDIKDFKIQEDSLELINKDLANMRFDPGKENSWVDNSMKDSEILATTSSGSQETGSLSSASPSSSSTYSPAKVGSIEYGEEYQSPVSVLDPFFADDANTAKFSYSGQLQPRRIAFEDRDYMNEDESIQEYVRAVLQAAGFNWNNHLQNRPSQDEILNKSIPYGDILLQIKTDVEPQLLVDIVNDVILDLYQQHFGCAPFTSAYIKPITRSLSIEQHFINQAVKEVKGAVFPEYFHPTMEQIIGRDIAKTSSWLDIRVDIEELVNRIAEDVLEILIHDGISIMLST